MIEIRDDGPEARAINEQADRALYEVFTYRSCAA